MCMATIRIQLVGEYFYPTDAISEKHLTNLFELGRFPKRRFDEIMARAVVKGYSFAVANYTPTTYGKIDTTGLAKLGGVPKATKDPCVKCVLRGLCDNDECGAKSFRLHSKVTITKRAG